MKLLTAKFVDFMRNRGVTSAKRFSGVFSGASRTTVHFMIKKNKITKSGEPTPTQSRNTVWGKTCKREFGVNCSFKFWISNLNITILLVSLLLPDFEQINKRSMSCSLSPPAEVFLLCSHHVK